MRDSHEWSCRCEDCSELRREMYALDTGVDALRLAVDLCVEAKRVEIWKAVAKDLAKALYMSGWAPHSGGTQALDEYNRLLREDEVTSVGLQT